MNTNELSPFYRKVMSHLAENESWSIQLRYRDAVNLRMQFHRTNKKVYTSKLVAGTDPIFALYHDISQRVGVEFNPTHAPLDETVTLSVKWKVWELDYFRNELPARVARGDFDDPKRIGLQQYKNEVISLVETRNLMPRAIKQSPELLPREQRFASLRPVVKANYTRPVTDEEIDAETNRLLDDAEREAAERK